MDIMIRIIILPSLSSPAEVWYDARRQSAAPSDPAPGISPLATFAETRPPSNHSVIHQVSQHPYPIMEATVKPGAAYRPDLDAGPSRSVQNRIMTTPKRGSSDRGLPPFLQTAPPPVDIPSGPRLEALYASTSAQRESNPTGYKVNSTWWAEAITETLRSGWLGNSAGSSRASQTPKRAGPSGSSTPRRVALSSVDDKAEGLGGESGGDRLIVKVDERMLKRLANEDGALPRGIGGIVVSRLSV